MASSVVAPSAPRALLPTGQQLSSSRKQSTQIAPKRLVQHQNARLVTSRTQMRVLATAAPAEAGTSQQGGSVEEAIQTLRRAAKDASSAPPKQVFAALRLLDREKPKGIDWPQVLAGNGGKAGSVRRWRLAYTAGAKEIAKAAKGGNTKGGMYWLVPPAAIGYRPDGVIENGVYLGWLASLKFEGNYDIKSNKLGFEFSKLRIKVGPLALPTITLKKEPTTSWDNPAKADGLFVFVYGDDEILVARGKSGGVALWEKAQPIWELENGVA